MSYCRFGPNSNVYMFESVEGHWECCGCWLVSEYGGRTKLQSPQAALDHLLEHRAAGHVVPEYAIDALKEEL